MKIVRKSAFTDIIREMDLPITAEQLFAYQQAGLDVEVAFPNLTEDQREFFLTGVTPDEWEEFTFHSEDSEEDEYNRGYN